MAAGPITLTEKKKKTTRIIDTQHFQNHFVAMPCLCPRTIQFIVEEEKLSPRLISSPGEITLRRDRVNRNRKREKRTEENRREQKGHLCLLLRHITHSSRCLWLHLYCSATSDQLVHLKRFYLSLRLFHCHSRCCASHAKQLAARRRYL